jgi:hypothetical protein
MGIGAGSTNTATARSDDDRLGSVHDRPRYELGSFSFLKIDFFLYRLIEEVDTKVQIFCVG